MGQSESMSVRALFDPRGVAIAAVGMGASCPAARTARDVDGVAALTACASQSPLRALNLLERDLNPVFALRAGAILGDVRVVVAGDAGGGSAASANRPDHGDENEGTA